MARPNSKEKIHAPVLNARLFVRSRSVFCFFLQFPVRLFDPVSETSTVQDTITELFNFECHWSPVPSYPHPTGQLSQLTGAKPGQRDFCSLDAPKVYKVVEDTQYPDVQLIGDSMN